MKTAQKGMSLIELVIVIGIIAILGAIVYPSYMDSVVKTRKTDGLAMINKVMQAQERFFVNNLTYTANLTQLGFASATNLPSEEGYYLISAAACGNGITSCVNITAVAQGSQNTAAADSVDNLGLNSQGTKTGKWPTDY